VRKAGLYKSIFRESNWLLELPFLTVKLLRKLTGILEVPGILRDDRNDFSDLLKLVDVGHLRITAPRLLCM
jgi:hypothetical protein